VSLNDGAPRYLEPLLGIVFDLDGTLVDSSHDFWRMRKEAIAVAQRYGVRPGVLSVDQTIARIMDTASQELQAARVPEGTVFRMEHEVHALIDAIEMEALPRTVPRPGATELLRDLTGRGFRLAILTRSSEEFCRGALTKTSLAEFFPYLRSRSSPGPSKPSPEALLLLLEEMEVPKERALFVGDHAIDAECSTRAQVRFYGVLPDKVDETSMTIDRFRALGAAAVAKDLPDLARHLGVFQAPGIAAGH
jgi:HAD superfamily hydrolase (TIGR01549 family)